MSNNAEKISRLGFILPVILFAIFFIVRGIPGWLEKDKGSFKDGRDSKTYKTIKIGTQTWMAENLNYNASSSKCYKDEENNCKKYGRFYNWNTAKSACPKGWHLPSGKEWQILVDFAGGDATAGKKLRTTSGWDGNSGNGTDDFGFSALPGGYANSSGNFDVAGYYGRWWSAESDGKYADYLHIGIKDEVNRGSYNSSCFLSVRCLQD